MKYDVTGIGGAAWDFLSIIEKPPRSGEKIKMSHVMEQGGGQTGTAIVTVARLGGKAAIAGVTGDDEAGEKIRNSFVTEGVDITALLCDTGKTSHIAFCFSLENSGERTMPVTVSLFHFPLMTAANLSPGFRPCACAKVSFMATSLSRAGSGRRPLRM